MRFKAGLFFSLVLILSVFNYAGAEKIGLEEAVDIALKDNTELKAYSWGIVSQEEDRRSVSGHLYPKIFVEEKVSRTDNPTYGFMSKLNQERFTQEDFQIGSLNDPDAITDYQTSISFEQALFVPKVFIGMGMSGKELEAKKAEYERKKEEVVLNVIKSFLSVHKADEFLKLARKAVKDAGEHEKLASVRYNAGTGLYSDVLRAEVLVKTSEADVIQGEGNLEVAKRALGLVLGKTLPVEINDERLVLPLNELYVYLESSKNRQDIRAFRLRSENAKKAVDLERAAYYPEAGVGGSYNMNDHSAPFSSEGSSYYVMGFLRWNLFDSSSNHKIKKARAGVNETAEHLAGLENMIHFRVNEAYTRVIEKEKRLALARAVLKESEEAVRLVRIRYENSLAPMVDLLDTQMVFNAARAGIVNADNDYISAISDLYYESGTLLKTITSLTKYRRH